MTKQLDRQNIQTLLEAEVVDDLPLAKLERLFRDEDGIEDFLPDGNYETDPRSRDRVIFNSARASRPHDNRPGTDYEELHDRSCLICQGRTTGIIDLAPLSEGFTFINKNLFPAFYPFQQQSVQLEQAAQIRAYSPDAGRNSGRSRGMHFLQWTSSVHDSDWHNLPLADAVVVMERLAALERKLLSSPDSSAKGSSDREIPPSDWKSYVLITKNFGRLVGGSLIHGHQQIALSNVMPKRFEDNWRFFERNGQVFSDFMQHTNPADLLVRDYGPAMLLVPYFMRRPYNMMLLMRDSTKGYLHQLSDHELSAVAEGWGDAIRAIRQIMPEIGRELAYNVVTHNGPGAGLYFEFLPYTQEHGGFEQLGLIVCQGNPHNVASLLREVIGN
jgi:galactose-1-phosphate uridylyltransferase